MCDAGFVLLEKRLLPSYNTDKASVPNKLKTKSEASGYFVGKIPACGYN